VVNVLDRITKDKGTAPNLRVGTPSDRCSGCAHFGYMSGRSWKGDGECYMYDVPVREDFLCDSFVSLDDLADSKPNSEGKGTRFIPNPSGGMKVAYNPFESVDVTSSNKIGPTPSMADLLKDLE